MKYPWFVVTAWITLLLVNIKTRFVEDSSCQLDPISVGATMQRPPNCWWNRIFCWSSHDFCYLYHLLSSDILTPSSIQTFLLLKYVDILFLSLTINRLSFLVPLVNHTFTTWHPYTRSPSSKLKRSRRTWPCNASDVAIEVVLRWRKWWLNHQKKGN